MLTIILFAVVGMIGAIISISKWEGSNGIPFDFKSIDDWGFFFNIGLIGAIVGAALGFVAAMLLNLTPLKPDDKVSEKDIKLVALNDDSQVEGSFFLFGGSLNENFYYVFYKETAKGIQLDKVPASTSFVHEEGQDARLHVTKITCEKNLWVLSPCGPEYQYDFYVPPGTVKRDFALDLE